MFQIQVIMAFLIICGILLSQVKKGRVRETGLYMLLIGCLIGAGLFLLFGMWMVVLLAAFGCAMAIKEIHYTF